MGDRVVSLMAWRNRSSTSLWCLRSGARSGRRRRGHLVVRSSDISISSVNIVRHTAPPENNDNGTSLRISALIQGPRTPTVKNEYPK